MKKGIVMERHRKYTILMTKDGSFVKGRVLSNQSEIGEEVVFRPIGNRQVMLRKHRGIPWKVSLLAAAILLVVLPMYFLSHGEKTFAYVTVDINPSIEMQVDEEFEVQTIEAINDDGEEIIKSLNEYEHHSIEEVIREIIIESEDQGFASERNMVVGISYLGEEISNSVPNHLQNYLSTLQDWRIATLVIPKEIRELAEEEETSMNEMMATHMNDNEEMIEGEALDSDDKAIINSFFNEIEEANPDSSQHESEKSEDTEVIIEEEKKDQETEQDIANSEQEKAVDDKDKEDQEVNVRHKEDKLTKDKKERNPENQWKDQRFPSEEHDKKKQHENLKKNHKPKNEIPDDEHKNDKDKWDEHHRTNSKHHKHSEEEKRPPKHGEKDNEDFK
ncbi:hypothetical protein [Oceanobacillus sp. 1P07AA]|uniref:anti-sigma factor domain-containing protein n=1 Tax=Oceanobacillus sp. 1P07AA TaxID=3132293 RepID=UPI0039A75659